MNLYLANVNYRFGDNAFLPYSAGRLWAYAQSRPEVAGRWALREILWQREPVADVIDRMRDAPPDCLGLSLYVWSERWSLALAREVRHEFPDCVIVAGGPQVPERETVRWAGEAGVDICVLGEGERQFASVLRLIDEGMHWVAPEVLKDRIEELTALPSPYLAGVFDSLVARNPHVKWQALQETNRGCPYQCLAGDALVDTVYGKMPIAQLAKSRKTVGVFTYDRSEGRAKVCTARNIKMLGRNKELVRVRFDDGSHIDCTPDHRFLTFKRGNQHVGEREWERFAADLQPGDRVRAIREELNPHTDRVSVTWSRRGSQSRARMVAEWKIGRALRSGEQVHHRDHDKSNDVPENLEVMDSALSHFAEHPEIAERMRARNPARFGLSKEWRGKISTSGRGKKRSAESRERYRLAALRREAAKTAEERSAQSARGIATRRKQGTLIGNSHRGEDGRFVGNHVVISVMPLPGLHDVYCLEVPETGWFYSNGVLVKNCAFCDWGSATYDKVRKFPVDQAAAELEWFARNRIELLYNCDANFGMLEQDVAFTEALVDVAKRTGHPQKFRAAYAKKINDRVFGVAKRIADAGLSKGATISFQSMEGKVLENVKRLNPVQKSLAETFERYHRARIPTYTELIIGLPGETYDSFVDGICSLLDAGQHDGLNCYPCMALRNSELSRPEQREAHGIRTVEVDLLLLHGEPDEDADTRERYELVIETATMPHEDWRRAWEFAIVVQALHCGGLSQKLARQFRADGMTYRFFYERTIALARSNGGPLRLALEWWDRTLDSALAGNPWATVLPEFGRVQWPPEEAVRLLVTKMMKPDLTDDWPAWARDVVWYGRKGGAHNNDEERVAA